jgi:hypothetical protein
MVVVMVWREARLHERQPKMLKGELENNSKNSRGQVKKTGIVTAKRKFNLLFLKVRRRKEMKLKMKMMMW